ncbi:MAG: hypothetical protein GY740_00065 [Gammaproteobacteria bacterium]|nr:hypothetical protein [Gammaproteobacteria bacterium]
MDVLAAADVSAEILSVWMGAGRGVRENVLIDGVHSVQIHFPPSYQPEKNGLFEQSQVMRTVNAVVDYIPNDCLTSVISLRSAYAASRFWEKLARNSGQLIVADVPDYIGK